MMFCKYTKIMRYSLWFFLFAFILSCVSSKARETHDDLSMWSLNGSKQFVLVRETEKTFPVVVFVHGGPGNPFTPYAQRIDPLFLRHFNVVHWDQRASGLSFKETKGLPLSIQLYVADLIELLKQIKVRFPQNKIVLVGASWGSLIALQTIDQRPDLADYYVGVGQMVEPLLGLRQTYIRLQQSNTPGIQEIGVPPWTTQNFFKFVGIATRSESYKNKMSFEETKRIAEASPFYNKDDLAIIEEGQALSITQLIQEIYKFNAIKKIRNLKIPVLFLQGQQDWITPTNLVHNFIQKNLSLKNVKLIEMKDYGHNLLLEAPTSVEEAIFDFFKEKK